MQENGEIYNKLNNKFKDTILTVDKYSSNSRADEGYEIKATADKMFLPSYSEMWYIKSARLGEFRT